MERLKELLEYANSLPNAEVSYRNDWDCYYCSILGKFFALMSEERITVKGDPEKNIELREMYSDIQEGYYTNKKYWNSIKTNTRQLKDDNIEILIYKSYQLVCQKLTKKEQMLLKNKTEENRK